MRTHEYRSQLIWDGNRALAAMREALGLSDRNHQLILVVDDLQRGRAQAAAWIQKA